MSSNLTNQHKKRKQQQKTTTPKKKQEYVSILAFLALRVLETIYGHSRIIAVL
jgi:hypothetical protein